MISASKKDLLEPITLEPWQNDNNKANLFCIKNTYKNEYLCYNEVKNRRNAYSSLEVVPYFEQSNDPDVFKVLKFDKEMYFELRFCQDAIEIFKEYLSTSNEDTLPTLKNAVDSLIKFCTNRNPGTRILNKKYGIHIARRQEVIHFIDNVVLGRLEDMEIFKPNNKKTFIQIVP